MSNFSIDTGEYLIPIEILQAASLHADDSGGEVVGQAGATIDFQPFQQPKQKA